MISLTFGLTLATYASAQVVSMIPNPNLAGASGSASSASASASYPAAATSSSSSDSSGYSTSPSADQYDQYGSSSSAYNQYGSSSTPSYNQYGSSSTPSYNQYTSAPPAQYTPPPMSEAMPYSSFMSGGYKSMDCGYGYTKGSDGSCMSTESWVRTSHLEISHAINLCDPIIYSILPPAAIRCISRPRSK
jgi:hypothetical protein